MSKDTEGAAQYEAHTYGDVYAEPAQVVSMTAAAQGPAAEAPQAEHEEEQHHAQAEEAQSEYATDK